jgi:hypothetical protein
MANVIDGAEPPFTKSESFKDKLDDEKVFESVGLDNIRSIMEADPVHDLVLYIRSAYVD